MSDELTLVAGGRALVGWEQISVTLRAEAFPNSFEISLSAVDPSNASLQIVRPGDACQVKLGSDIVITGYVDRVGNGGSGGNHTLRVVGRGKSQDLVDCSAQWDGGQIMSATAFDTATKLAAPYGISVRQANAADIGPPAPQFNLSYGETAAEIIQRIARSAGLLAYEDATGALVLAAAGKQVAASGVIYGQNVEDWDVELSMDQRFSEIVCTLQPQNTLGDEGVGVLFYDTETDPNVPRPRRIYMPLEQAVNAKEFTIRKAKWEVARRAGRATSVTATIDSWRDSAGTLWMPNTLIPVDLPGLPGNAGNLCISEVTFRRGPDGTHADLVLLPPAAFTPEPISLQPISTADQMVMT